MNLPCGNPHPVDDDLNDMNDLPPEVVLNVSHAESPPEKAEVTLGEILDALRDLGEEIAALRSDLKAVRVAPLTITSWGAIK